MTGDLRRLPFLLEIGSEEIPARFVPTAMAALQERLTALLVDLHLDADPVRVAATPRRLTAICDGVAVRQPDRREEVKGPPLAVAFDAAGQPTRAGLGFASKLGVAFDACERGRDQRGEYLLVRRTVAGRTAAAVLAEQLPSLVLSLPFRKTMRWGDLEIEYARPLQWLVCLLGNEVIPLTVGNLVSGRATRGHRTLAGDAARDIPACADYANALAALHVVIDPQVRRERILGQAAACLAELAEPAALVADEELLTEVVHLCEHPTAFVGSFATEYFELPAEVITTALKSHQRYFAVRRGDHGELLPRFVAVRDGGAEHLETVRAGNERVLQARLADALFYWRFDQQRTPEQHAAELARVTWLEGFGSVADQTRRAAALVEHLWQGGLGAGGDVPAPLRRAAALNRFDLVTEMIKDGKEFTKLEGIIAAHYAAAAGEDPTVCRILAACQLPRSATDSLPGDPLSDVLSVAWRLDTLAGCWLAGFVPTGAKDPYALRRHALAVLRILLERRARVDLRDLLGKALAPYREYRPDADPETTAAELLAFIMVRLETWLTDSGGAELAVVRAVLPVRGQDPADAAAWIEALHSFRNQHDFLLLARGFKRCTNILERDVLAADQRLLAVARWQAGGRGAAGEDFGRLVQAQEQRLHQVVAGSVPELLAAEAAEDYVSVFKILASFGPVIDTFFDTVRVNTDDPELRRLRHVFLREIHALFQRYADFSLVAPEEG
jgi:glycyl-tRNA synthetase beta chain